MLTVQNIIETLNEWIWGPPLLFLLVVVGMHLTVRTRVIQFRYLIYGHKLAFSRQDNSEQGDISHFQALMTALAATIGIGSITSSPGWQRSWKIKYSENLAPGVIII